MYSRRRDQERAPARGPKCDQLLKVGEDDMQDSLYYCTTFLFIIITSIVININITSFI